MDYEVHNKNSLSYDIMLSNEVEYTNQLTNMDADNAVDKLLRDVAILKQEVTILEGDIATMKLDVKTHQKDIEMAQGQIRDINTRLGTIDLVIADIQEKLEEKASIEYVDGEVATVEVGVTTNKEVIESINTTLGEEDLSTTSQNVKGAINEVLDNTVANTEAIENIDLSQYRGIISNIDEMVEDGTYYVAVGDKTFPYHYGMVVVSFGNGEKFATFQTSGNDVKYYYNTGVLKTEGLVWQGWKELATTDNTIRTYKSLVEINPTFTENTPLKDVILTMKSNTMAVYEILGAQGVYPSTYSLVTIYKVAENRNRVEVTNIYGKEKWITNYHSSNNPNCEWTKLLTDEELHIPNNPQPSYKHFVQAWGGKYFSTSTEEKDLNNVFDNIMCYTTASDRLENLPTGESGGSGWFKSETNFKNFNANQHTLQTYANTDDGGVFLRCYNQDFEEWTEWKQLTSEKKVYMSASMLKNGWTLKTDYDNSYVVTDKTVSLNLSVNGGTLTSNTIICEGLPKRNQNNNVPIILRGTNGTSHIVFYTTDGKLTLSGDVSSIGSWGFINATINL